MEKIQGSNVKKECDNESEGHESQESFFSLEAITLEIEALRSELLHLKTARKSEYHEAADGGYNARPDLTSKVQQKKKISGPARKSEYNEAADGGYNARPDLTSKVQQKKKISGPGDGKKVNVNLVKLNPVLGGANWNYPDQRQQPSPRRNSTDDMNNCLPCCFRRRRP